MVADSATTEPASAAAGGVTQHITPTIPLPTGHRISTPPCGATALGCGQLRALPLHTAAVAAMPERHRRPCHRPVVYDYAPRSGTGRSSREPASCCKTEAATPTGNGQLHEPVCDLAIGLSTAAYGRSGHRGYFGWSLNARSTSGRHTNRPPISDVTTYVSFRSPCCSTGVEARSR